MRFLESANRFRTMLESERKFLGFVLAMNILTLRKTCLVNTKYMCAHTHTSTLPFLTSVLTLGSQLYFNSAEFSAKINLLAYLPEEKVGSRTQ